jgi:hypothetical protein
MQHIPSSIPFASFLQYAPQGTSSVSLISKAIVITIKSDGFYSQRQIIPYAVERFALSLDKLGAYQSWFSPRTLLVPTPRSAPIVQGGVFPGYRICEELQKQALGGEIAACLKRTVAIRKSATARGNRPDPIEHYNSVSIDSAQTPLFPPERVLLVDDVVTRGSTFLGLVPRLREGFPHAQILCFALVRTMSKVEIDRMDNPISGVITFDGVMPHREP